MSSSPPRRTSTSASSSRGNSNHRSGGRNRGATRSGGARSQGAASNNPSRSASPRADLFATAATLPDGTDTFASLGLSSTLVAELTKQGIETPFPIQAATIADCLAGRDVLGRAKTGSGKTLAFALPMLSLLAASRKGRKPGSPRALVLAPTRELAVQIKTVMEPYARMLSLSMTTIFGGVGAVPQIKALRNGVDIVIACPGRLLDHIKSGHASLAGVEITVLDEADHMADMGFLPDVRKILDRTPEHSQRLLFSATLDNGIDSLVREFLHDPIVRSVETDSSEEGVMVHHVLAVDAAERVGVLRELAAAPGRILVFTRTKHGAKKLAKVLTDQGVPAVEMHGNLSQNARVRNLEAFRAGTAPTMVATDVAARGIHVDDVGLVVHFDPPVDHKAYLHRSGRTARAGADGIVVTLMAQGQQNEVRTLTKQAGIHPTTTSVACGHPLLSEIAPGERVYLSATDSYARLPQSDTPRSTPSRAPRGGAASSARPARSGERTGGRGGNKAVARSSHTGAERTNSGNGQGPARGDSSRAGGSSRGGSSRGAAARPPRSGR